MNEDDKLQKLLRLKRYEQPPEDFAEEFLEKFQRRQRADLMRRSALSILWERVQAWVEGFRRPVFLWGAAAVYALVMAGLWLWPKPAPDTGTTLLVGTERPRVNAPAVSNNPNGTVINAVQPPGKRRTPDQEQDKKPAIGPERRPLRDL